MIQVPEDQGWLTSLPEDVILNTSSFLAEGHHFPLLCGKRHVALHLTEGASARSSFDWLMTQYTKVMVPFFVDRDGTVYQTYPFNKWSYHLGNGVANVYNLGSIGIEVANMGPLRKQGSDLYNLYNLKKPFCSLSDTDRYKQLEPYYRDYGYFESFPAEQVKAVRVLVHKLCDLCGIPKQFIDNPWTVEPSRNYRLWEGVTHHGKWRFSKLDWHPACPIDDLCLEGDWSWPA
jgi:N-acetyl-anhydromuramyl-L-alanine amidase AmpD